MKRWLGILLAGFSLSMLLGACAKKPPAQATDTVTDRKIPVGDVTEFYYTYENINYNAFYQRYRFWAEDGKHFFYHETRERPNDYGWTTEEDITASGTLALGDDEWAQFTALLKNGTVRARTVSDEAGDSGPWLYLYWKGDKGTDQEFSFASAEEEKAFEEFCAKLAKRAQ